LARWRNYFFQLLNVHRVNVWQTEIHTKEPTVPASNASEVELATEQLKSHKSTGIDLIPEELIKAGDRTIRFKIHKLITSICNKDKLPEGWKESIIVPIYKKGEKID
jgi:hypothetical protein